MYQRQICPSSETVSLLDDFSSALHEISQDGLGELSGKYPLKITARVHVELKL